MPDIHNLLSDKNN